MASQGWKKEFLKVHQMKTQYILTDIQLAFTCSKSAIETPEKGVKYFQSCFKQ